MSVSWLEAMLIDMTSWGLVERPRRIGIIDDLVYVDVSGSTAKAVSMSYGRLSSRQVASMGVWICGRSDWSLTLECSQLSLKDSSH